MGVIGKGERAVAAVSKGLEGTKLRAQHLPNRTLVRLQVVGLHAAGGCGNTALANNCGLGAWFYHLVVIQAI